MSLDGQVIVISGTLLKKRSVVVATIHNNGGLVSNSINKKTAYLLLGPDKRNGGKHRKAIKYGIPVISENDFEKILKGRVANEPGIN
ncbi:BRCT domain-containing protein [Syntrophomonas palmitatica]|uniref:BRCT domain-containing protein n=1 Tax=Syntrophomonas palmitatica TaxID=402877 RepID=UPI0006D020AB|nr:BRCT domain-containing protein [Syntrophomonas palmitatica]